MRSLRSSFLLLLVLFASARAVSARPLEVPTFTVGPDAEVAGLRVAVGGDGTMVFAWESAGEVWSQRFTQAGAVVAPPVAIAAGAAPRLAADTRGGYVVAYLREADGRRRLFGYRLDAAGIPVGGELAVDQAPPDDVLFPDVLGLPTGFAFVWQQGSNCWLRRYDPDGAVLGAAAAVGDNGWGFPLAAAALDDGGIAVVWHDPSVHTFLGKTFSGDGSLRFGPAFLPSVSLDVTAIAATTAGGFAAAGVVLFRTLRLVQFSPTFTVVGQHDVEVLPSDFRPIPTVARGPGGRWYVPYATARYAPGYTQLLGYDPPRARPLAADLTPLEPSFALGAEGAPQVATALLPSGSFVNAWSTAGPPGSARGFANVVSLCTPDVHVCGDGVFDSRCEECDAGAGNSDTAPDACRTTCVLPSCGDGVTDAAETCDDGDPSPCDGCDALCAPVAGLACGDGILVDGCGAQCDDGNAVVGDGCAPQCTLERVAGGGSSATDCLAEWIVVNPTNDPLVDGRGRLRRTQRCVDDDPQCDFDGGVPGACTFRLQACAGNTDLVGCTPSPLFAWTLTKPSLRQAASRPELAAARSAFDSVAAAITNVAASDVCSPLVEVVVPLRGAAPTWRVGKLALGARATTAQAVRDSDGLTLMCVPQ